MCQRREVRLLLSSFTLGKKRKRTIEETVALIQQGDATLQDELIESYKPFIARTVSTVCQRYIYETDDEFSIGLIAFNEAIEKYHPHKGDSLLSFAEVIIRHRVIDYIRNNCKDSHLSFDLQETTEETLQIERQISIENYEKNALNESRKEEIIRFQQILKDYDLQFSDLVEQSPKHADARKNAILIAKTLSEHEELFQILVDTKRLPIKQLQEIVKVSRKTIERNRKYIIAVAIILNKEFIFLQDYLKGVLET